MTGVLTLPAEAIARSILQTETDAAFERLRVAIRASNEAIAASNEAALERAPDTRQMGRIRAYDAMAEFREAHHAAADAHRAAAGNHCRVADALRALIVEIQDIADTCEALEADHDNQAADHDAAAEAEE